MECIKIKPMDTTTDTLPRPALIMIRGLPGSGKSYVADALRTALGADKVVILDPDKIDKTAPAYIDLCAKLTAEGVEDKFFPNRFLKTQGYDALAAGKYVIWNQAFTDLMGFTRSMGSLQEFAAEHDIPLPVLVVEVEISHDTAKQRVAQREAQGGHGVSEEAFARFISAYRSFADDGFNTVTVDGDADVAASVAAVRTALAASK